MDLLTIVRWLHVISGAAWLGEVVTVVFVLVPIARRLQGNQRASFIARVFPGVFRTATVLAILTLAAGAWLNYLITGWQHLGVFLTSVRGVAILVGGLLGLLLALFHFIVEGRMESEVQALDGPEDVGALRQVSRFLTFVPRLGLAILLVIFILMMIGARGI
jgi:uncharacterized membrane protein